MTIPESISYLIITLHQLDYPYQEILRIRKEYEAQLQLQKEDVELEVAILLAKLIRES